MSLIVGHSTLDIFRKAEWRPGPVRLSARRVFTPQAGPVDFDVRDGEMLGLVGLRGAGQEEIGRALYGAIPHGGTIVLDDVVPDLSSPRAALRAGVGLVARDRTEESVAPSLSVRENAFINPGAAGRGLFSVRSPRAEARQALDLGVAIGLRPNDPDLPIEGLSGGNQQKVVVGRWLVTGRRLLVAEDPTAGVDVGAKAEIYRLIARAMEQGPHGRRRLHRLRGGRPHLPPRAGLQQGPDHRRARRQAPHDRIRHHRGVRLRSGLNPEHPPWPPIRSSRTRWSPPAAS